MASADQAFEKGDFAAALKSYQWHRVDADHGPQARIKTGHCLLKLGKTAAAVREWKSIRDSWPDAPEAAAALALEIANTRDAAERAKLEATLLATYAQSREAKAMQAGRAKGKAAAEAKITPESELDQLLAAGKREEAVKYLASAARRASGGERDRLLAQLATLYESGGDWRRAAAAWRKIAEEGNVEHREAATFDWIRTTAAIGRNAGVVEGMWLKFLSEYPTSSRGHVVVTRLAELMVSQEREDEAAELLEGWLNSAAGKTASANLISKRLAELRQQNGNEKGGAISSFGKERLDALAKLPGELQSLCEEAKTGKRTGNILNRIRDIRRGLVGAEVDTLLMLQLDRTEALALNGQRDHRKALDLLDDTWIRKSKAILESKESALAKAAGELTGDALGIALEAGNHPSAVMWAERSAGPAFPAEEAVVGRLKNAALRLVLADAKTEGIAVLSILENTLLARMPEASRLRAVETATVARLKTLCANGKDATDNAWFAGEIPAGQGGSVAKRLLQADLLFAARETKGASRAYSDLIRMPGIDQDTEGYATMQLARCFTALGEFTEALRNYRHFENRLGGTKSAAPALLRAGTLCGGPMNDTRSAKAFFAMVSTRYPAAPEAELCDWYTANLLLWEGNRRESRTAFDLFERKYPNSAFLTALDQSIRPQLAQR